MLAIKKKRGLRSPDVEKVPPPHKPSLSPRGPSMGPLFEKDCMCGSINSPSEQILSFFHLMMFWKS